MMTLVSPTDKTGNFKVHRANVDSDSDVCISDPHQFQTPVTNLNSTHPLYYAILSVKSVFLT